MENKGYEFKAVDLVNTMKDCVTYIANNALLVVTTLSRGAYTERRSQGTFDFHKDAKCILMRGMRWRAIEVKNRCFWFVDGDLDKFEFEKTHGIDIGTNLEEEFSKLSKNKKKVYKTLHERVQNKLTYKRVFNYLRFLDEELGITYSTSYGFDGGVIHIKHISDLGDVGLKRREIKVEMKKNREEIEKCKDKIALLMERNRGLRYDLDKLG